MKKLHKKGKRAFIIIHIYLLLCKKKLKNILHNFGIMSAFISEKWCNFSNVALYLIINKEKKIFKSI